MAMLPPVNRSFMDKTQQFSQGAIQSRSAMRRPEAAAPPKTAGGAISSAAGMGMAGYMIGGTEAGTAIGGPGWGSVIGAGIGLAAYYLS